MTTQTHQSESDSQNETIDITWPAPTNKWVKKLPEEGAHGQVEYWRKGSSHVNGTYQRLSVTETRDGSYRLRRTTFDKFGYSLTSHTILPEHGPDNPEFLQTSIKEHMESNPGREKFDEQPSLPASVGEWILVSGRTDGDSRHISWELGFGSAELHIVQESVNSRYCGVSREYGVRYQEPDSDEEIIVSGIPRTQAFEIGVATMSHITRPVSEMRECMHELQAVDGIGPAKARAFILLGLTSIQDLKKNISLNENEQTASTINYHHGAAVETFVTSRIRESLR
jgi:hypothetical protein